jgi:hypothetical protein
MSQIYTIDHKYLSKGNPKDKSDQFMRWINRTYGGINNSRGISNVNYYNKGIIPAFIVLTTKEKKNTTTRIPWEDIIDLNEGLITYWGDAKWEKSKSIQKKYDLWAGNKLLKQLHELVLSGEFIRIPPILHFTRISENSKKYCQFNGLCALNDLQLCWMESCGKRVLNYKATLSILNANEVDMDWLHDRRSLGLNDSSKADNIPTVWNKYAKTGIKERLDVHQSLVKSRENQLPKAGTSDAKILHELFSLTPRKFEFAIVSILEQLPNIHQQIETTRQTADGGFDFLGHFKLPEPMPYIINIKGEVKRYSRVNGVPPKDVSRLVARLRRNEFGIFATTSYFTSQAQREVINDEYPVHLIAGIDLVDIIKTLGLLKNNSFKEWFSLSNHESITS